MRRILYSPLLPTILLILSALILLVGSTYAWFSFRPYSIVTPLKGTVSSGDADLRISATENGEFKDSCDMICDQSDIRLLPISTEKLTSFYAPSSQSIDGIALSFTEAEERAKEYTLSGTVYLKTSSESCRVFFWKPQLSFGENAQALAAMRLGLIISTKEGEHTHIFSLDDMSGDIASAEERRTIPVEGMVVSSLEADGVAVYAEDPAKSIDAYCAGGTENEPTAGENELCKLTKDEVASVRFILYLEGCDNNCINSAQLKDIALRLSFAGVK